jgi:sugar phosphate permease
MPHKRFPLYAWLIWFTASLFYGIEYFQRVAPTVMADPLMKTFGLTATSLGAISSLYFYAYAAAQIPVGILLDRYNSRYFLALSCTIISIGSLLFAITEQIHLLAVARILIGFGSAFAFIGVLKLASNWYSADQYPLMVGLTNTLGVLGAIAGQAPLAHMVVNIGWQKSLMIISVIGLGISVLLALIIRDKPQQLCKNYRPCFSLPKQASTRQILLQLIRSKQTWLTAIYAGLMVAPIIAFAELWSVPFLTRAYQISPVNAASLNTAIFVGIGVGGPLNGWLANRWFQSKTIMTTGNIFALGCLTLIIYSNSLSYFTLLSLLFFFGLFTSSMLLAFNLNKERHPLSFNASVVALTNMMIMIMGAIYQPSIGKLLDLFISTTAGHYSTQDFHYSLAILPITLVISLLLLTQIKNPAKPL